MTTTPRMWGKLSRDLYKLCTARKFLFQKRMMCSLQYRLQWHDSLVSATALLVIKLYNLTFLSLIMSLDGIPHLNMTTLYLFHNAFLYFPSSFFTAQSYTHLRHWSHLPFPYLYLPLSSTGIVYHLSKEELDKYDIEHEKELAEAQRRGQYTKMHGGQNTNISVMSEQTRGM
jgi:hypothetical protein